MQIHRRLFLFACLFAGTLVAAPVHAQNKVPVVASFSILSDLVRQIGGDRVQITTLVGAGGDAHVYSPKPADVAALSRAKLVVFNGLGFEGWADRLLQSAEYRGEYLVATRGVKALRGGGGADPHAWQEVANVKIYVANIRDALSKVDPVGSATYAARSQSYMASLDRLDREIRATFARIPQDRRRVVTSHDAFGYFGDAYDVVFMAPQGLSTGQEPSAAAVAGIVRQIRERRITALFVESISNRAIITQIARETGVAVGGTLYSDALSGAGSASTYIGMMRHNAISIAKALQK